MPYIDTSRYLQRKGTPPKKEGFEFLGKIYPEGSQAEIREHTDCAGNKGAVQKSEINQVNIFQVICNDCKASGLSIVEMLAKPMNE